MKFSNRGGGHVKAGAVSRHGFTLVELLVVIAIIALLVGILLPALVGARNSSRQVKCQAQCQQMGLILTYYANDWKSWFPIIPLNQLGLPTWNSPNPALDQQWAAGGVAGLFSLYQNPTGGEAPASPSDPDIGYVSVGDVNNQFYNQPANFNGLPITLVREPLLRAYINGSFGVLTCPADKEDRNYGPMSSFNPNSARALPQAPIKVPKIPNTEYEVVSYNISYLYIAGFKTDEGNIVTPAPLWGDETMAPDLSTRAWYFDSRDRPTDEGIRQGFYHRWDNHGADGANFVHTDGHVDLVKFNVQETFFGPASTSPKSVNSVDPNRSRRLQTID